MTMNEKDERSLSVSGIVKFKDDYLFLIQNPGLWKKDTLGNILLPFGTVEGKIKKGEDAETALKREFMEEIGANVDVKNSQTSHFIYKDMVDEVNVNAKSNRPLFIYKNELNENNQKKYSYTFSFIADPENPEEIKPKEKPAILIMNKMLLNKAVKGNLSVKELKAQGGKIISNIELPESGLLVPTPTPKGIYLCGGNCR